MSSIMRNFQPVILQEKKKIQQPSGQWKDTWVDIKTIDLGIYPANHTILTSGNIKYSESTNTGLTPEKDIKEVINRIFVSDKEIYDITFANPSGRYTSLFLKRVVVHGG